MPDTQHLEQAKTMPRVGRLHSIVQRRFLLLFLILVASLILYPYAEFNPSTYVAFRMAGSAAILLSVYAIGLRRSLIILGLVLAIPALVQHILEFHADAGWFQLLSICLSFIFDAFIITVMFRRVFSAQKPNSETIFGALSIYLLIGFSFASLYGMVATVQPHAFYLNPVVNTHTVADRFDFIYYSFGTMTALGAEGITAVSRQARSLTVIQALLGLLYLAVLIARLISAYGMRASAARDGGELLP